MTKLLKLAALLAACTACPAQAHVSYTNRDLGSYGPAGGSMTISNQTVSGNFGWADGLDADFGDSHRLRAFRFTLTMPTTVNLTAEANPGATPTSVGGLLPGFSVYAGLAHLPPAQADYDDSAATLAYLESLPGVPKEGAFRAMADWQMTNDAGDPFSVFHYQGSAFDADLNGVASGSFALPAGDYSVFVGGVNYVAQIGAVAPYPAYGLKLTLDVAPAALPVPEPEAYVLLLAGLGVIALAARRRA